MKKFKCCLMVFLFLLVFLPTQATLADVGPKPTMEFTFVQSLPGGSVTITSGTLYECEQSDCRDAQPLQELGPQRLTCDAESCHALAYGFSQYHRLEVQFSDGRTRQSNIFQTAGFDSIYKVTVRPDDLLVETQFNPGNLLPQMPFSFSLVLICICLLGLIVVVLVVVIVFLRRRSKKQ